VTHFAGAGRPSGPKFADGTGTGAGFYGPHGIAVDHSGNVYVADSGNARIRKITPAGVVSTIFQAPWRVNGLALDTNGNLYISSAQAKLVAKVVPKQ
jgi:sugar lactone lactonase YvrE